MADQSHAAGLHDEDIHLDLRPLLRIGGWGAGAIFATLVAILVGQSEDGARRAGVAVAALTGAPSEQSLRTTGAEMLARADSEREVRRLSEGMRVLAGDRDRLANRLALLERNLDDLTGSVARQSGAARPPNAGNGNSTGPAPVAAAPDTVRAHTNGAQIPAPPPAPAAAPSRPPPAAVSQAPLAPLPAATAPPPTMAVPRPPALAIPPSANAANPVIGPAEDSLLLSALPLIMPKEPAPEVVPLPRPGPVAMLQAYATAATPAAPAIPAAPARGSNGGNLGNDPATTEFAADLGAAPNLNAVRALWDKVKARQGPALEGLRPLVNIRDGAKPGTTELRLVVGPLANPAAVARVCAALIAVALPCQPGIFDGQRLAQR